MMGLALVAPGPVGDFYVWLVWVRVNYFLQFPPKLGPYPWHRAGMGLIMSVAQVILNG